MELPEARPKERIFRGSLSSADIERLYPAKGRPHRARRAHLC